MIKVLKSLLILHFIGGAISPFIKLGFTPASIFIITLNSVLVFLLWKGLISSVKTTQSKGNTKQQIVRWLVLSYFSTLAIEIGVLFAFIARFFLDANYQQLATVPLILQNIYIEVMTLLFPLVVSLPIIIVIAKTLGFQRYKRSALILFAVWVLLLHIPQFLH